jgi:hypothetical protein
MSRAAIVRLMLSRMRVDTTDRDDMQVVYAASPSGPGDIPGAAKRAWAELEAFDALARDSDVDDSRPFLEFYRREREVDVLVPVRQP